MGPYSGAGSWGAQEAREAVPYSWKKLDYFYGKQERFETFAWARTHSTGVPAPPSPQTDHIEVGHVGVVGHGHLTGTDIIQSYLLLIRSVALGATPQQKLCCLYFGDFTVNKTIEVPEQPLGGGVEDC